MATKYFGLTDADVTLSMLKEAVNIENRIEELERDENVLLAKRYNETKGQRLEYLQQLKQLERLGRRLRDIGWEVPRDAESEESV